MAQQLSQLGQTLLAAQNPNPQIQKQAETQIQSAQQAQLPQFAIALCGELGKQSNPANVRQMAGLILKNALCGKSEEFQQQAQQRWLAVPPAKQSEVKKQVLQCLASPVPEARGTSAQIIGKIARIDLPRNQWNDLVPLLVSNIKRMSNPNMAEACLKALGYVCEECQPELLAQASSQILDAIATGMRKNITNDGVKKAAVMALINSMEFIRSNFEQQAHRNMIMQLVLECCVWKPQSQQHQQSAKEIRMYSFNALYLICKNYYEHLTPYIKAVFQTTVNSMKSDHADVAKQAIEFWSTCADEELEIMYEIEDHQKYGGPEPRRAMNFLGQALGGLSAALLQCLTKQADDIEDDSWTVAKAAGACLGLVSQVAKDAIAQHALKFIQQHINGQHWRQKEAAVIAFGLIMDGPDPKKLQPLVSQAFGIILKLIGDENNQVKDSAAWTLGRVCEFVPMCINNQQILQNTMGAFQNGLKGHPKVAANICWAITNLAEKLSGPDEETMQAKPTSPLSNYVAPLIQMLLQRSQQSDADEANLLSSCYESINSLITNAPQDVVKKGVVQNFANSLLQQLAQSFNQNQNDPRVQTTQLALLGSLNGVVTTLSLHEHPCIQQLGPNIMKACIRALQARNPTVHEECFMIVGAVALSMKATFAQFMAQIAPQMVNGLKAAQQEPNLARVCLGCIGDIARGIGQAMKQYADQIVGILLQQLMSQELQLDLKPPIIECLSDVVLSLGSDCDRYLQHVMKLVLQAGAVKVANADLDTQDTLEDLRVAVLEICSATLQSLAIANKQMQFLSYMNGIEQLLGVIGTDPNTEKSASVLKNTCALIGDMVQNCPPQNKQMMVAKMRNPIVQKIVMLASKSKEDGTIKQAQWCQKMLS